MPAVMIAAVMRTRVIDMHAPTKRFSVFVTGVGVASVIGEGPKSLGCIAGSV